MYPNRPRDAAILYPVLIARRLSSLLVPTNWNINAASRRLSALCSTLIVLL